jgi:hypothetical protein
VCVSLLGLTGSEQSDFQSLSHFIDEKTGEKGLWESTQQRQRQNESLPRLYPDQMNTSICTQCISTDSLPCHTSQLGAEVSKMNKGWQWPATCSLTGPAERQKGQRWDEVTPTQKECCGGHRDGGSSENEDTAKKSKDFQVQ